MIRNILICTTQIPFTSGGAEALVSGLQSALKAAGFNAETVALPFRWYPPVEIMRGTLSWRLLNLAESNGKPVDLVIGVKFPAYAVAHSRKILWVIHQHRTAYNLWGTPFDDLSSYPEGAQVRDFIRNCDQRVLAEAHKIFSISATVGQRMLHYNRVKSETLYHPPPRAECLFSEDLGDYVFCPSRLEPQKRQELLIEAMRHVATPVSLLLAGGSSDLASFEMLLKKHDVAERVTLLGYVSDNRMTELYARALAVAYVPFDEDYGYVTLESMLSRRPVIVTSDSGGPCEFVEHGATGLIVTPDPVDIASAINELHHDRERARLLGKRAEESIRALNLSWDHVVEKLISSAQ